MQAAKRREAADKQNETQKTTAQKEEESEWGEEHPIDWDAYFEEGATSGITGMRVSATFPRM